MELIIVGEWFKGAISTQWYAMIFPDTPLLQTAGAHSIKSYLPLSLWCFRQPPSIAQVSWFRHIKTHTLGGWWMLIGSLIPWSWTDFDIQNVSSFSSILISSSLTLLADLAGQGGVAGEQLPANDEAGSRRSRERRRLRVQGTGTDTDGNFETNRTDGNNKNCRDEAHTNWHKLTSKDRHPKNIDTCLIHVC